MDVQPTGTDRSANIPKASSAQASRIATAGQVDPSVSAGAADSVSTILQELSTQDVLKLLPILERSQTLESGYLLSTIVRAVSDHDVDAAMAAVNRMASLDPQRAEGLRSQPDLHMLRPEIEQLLSLLSRSAKIDAEQKLAQATELTDVHAARILPDWNAPPATFLRMAHNLLDTGGLVNYAKAAEIAQLIIDGLRFFPVPGEARGPGTLKRDAKGTALPRATADSRADRRSLRKGLLAVDRSTPWMFILTLIGVAILVILVFSSR